MIYNIIPTDFLTSIGKLLTSKAVIKKRIPIEDLEGITIKRFGHTFVLHLKGEKNHDYLLHLKGKLPIEVVFGLLA
jgi:hypothetical protein